MFRTLAARTAAPPSLFSLCARRLVSSRPAAHRHRHSHAHAHAHAHAHSHGRPNPISRSQLAMSGAPPALEPLPATAQLSPRVLTVLGQNPGRMTLQGTNTYLVGTGATRILIDTGEGVVAWADNLRALLAQHGCTALSAILLTHWHHDHVGGLPHATQLLAPGGAIFKAQGARDIPAPLLARCQPPHGLAPLAVRPIADGQLFETEGARLTALSTPGHTEDHTSFLLQEEGAVFSGDTILGAGTAVFSDLHSYLHSLKKIHSHRPRRIYPAHGPLVDGADAPARIEQYIAHRAAREQQIVRTLRQRHDELRADGQLGREDGYLTASDIVRRIYTDLDPSLHLAAANNVLLHLAKLQRDAAVEPCACESPPAHGQQHDGGSHAHPHAHAHTPDAASSATAAASPAPVVETDDCDVEVSRALAETAKRIHWRWKLMV